MSSDKPPFDPFGRSDRTVIRPNPGGRRPAAEPRPQQTPAFQPAPAFQPPPFQPPPPAQVAADDWAVGPAHKPVPQPGYAYQQPAYAPPPPAPPATSRGPATPEVMALKRDVPVAPNENPLLQAAGPLLLLLGRLRASLMHARFSNLMDQVADAIDGFEKDVRGAGYTPEQLRVAKYALCATADDIVQNIPGEDKAAWTQYSMLYRFFNERTGGVRFFEELERARQDPVVNYPVLELQHACLALGFQGVHRTSGGGPAALQQIQRNLYETLRRVRPRSDRDLSPRWEGQDIPPATAGFSIPLWAIGAVVGAILLVLFLTLRFLLAGNAETVAEEVQKLVPEGPVALFREQPAPPPPPVVTSTQLECIRAALAVEISEQKITLAENANSVIIRVGAFASFDSGQATVLDSFKPVGARLAAVLDKEPGAIRIIGHSDSTRIATARFPSNFHLSVERAQAVAALLKERLADPARLQVEGKGADQPVAPNTTAEGRARNRRVELVVPRRPAAATCPQL
jgi:type VI secretion system protein ImpK